MHSPKIRIPAHAPKLAAAEEALMHSVAELKECNCIFRELLTINELVEPLEEKEISCTSVEGRTIEHKTDYTIPIFLKVASIRIANVHPQLLDLCLYYV